MIAHVVYRARQQLHPLKLSLIGIFQPLQDINVEEIANRTNVSEVASISFNRLIDQVLDWQDQFILGILSDMGTGEDSCGWIKLFKGEFIDVSGDKLLGSGHGIADKVGVSLHVSQDV